MKIAILGGGFTGLTASYYLAKKGHEATVFEKEKLLGGLASGIRAPDWDWYLEKSYHHLFANDRDILDFAKEIGFNGIFFQSPETASLYKFSEEEISNNFRIFPLDTPQDLLRFPLLTPIQKTRAGATLAFLKLAPFFPFFEKQTAEEFLKKTMGNDVWNILWRQLFRKKFGKYAENILAPFIWARIKKRTKKLGYVEGGFQNMVNFLEEKDEDLRVIIKKDQAVTAIAKKQDKFVLSWTNGRDRTFSEEFDAVISTLPTPILIRLGQRILPKNYLTKIGKIKHLHALNIILETKEPILPKTYWLNICSDKLPLMIIAQHTNFVDKKYYNNNHVAYVGWYLEAEDKLFQMTRDGLTNYCLPHLKSIIHHQPSIINSYLFKGPLAQPIFDKDFLESKPDFITPIKKFYVANLDMTYPYDRGTNFAVRLGKKVAELI